MEVFSYNRESVEGLRVRRLLDVQYNVSQLDENGETKTFRMYQVPAVMHSRVNKVKFLFQSNLSGLKRPQIHVDADVELAWGDFADHISALNFKHDSQELPLTYVQPLEDETIKVLIDAGLYSDDRFEQLMDKLMNGETFDAEGNMNLMYLDVGEAAGMEGSVPVVLVDPLNIVHEKYDPSERTNLAELVRLAAKNAIELQNEGVKSEDLVRSEPVVTKEIFIEKPIQDVVSSFNEQRIVDEVDDSFRTSSTLLDQEIDVTDQIKGMLNLNRLTEDDVIEEIKERERYEALQKQAEMDAISHSNMPGLKTVEAENPLDPNIFVGGIGSKRIILDQNDKDHDNDGPDL